jgi:hypothetical protein
MEGMCPDARTPQRTLSVVTKEGVAFNGGLVKQDSAPPQDFPVLHFAYA